MESNNLNNPPFHIGQLVTCIESHPFLSMVRKGNQFEVLDLIRMECGHWAINIGISSDVKFTKCNKCDSRAMSNGIYWIGAFRFSEPKEQSFPSMTTKEIVKKELKLVSLN